MDDLGRDIHLCREFRSEALKNFLEGVLARGRHRFLGSRNEVQTNYLVDGREQDRRQCLEFQSEVLTTFRSDDLSQDKTLSPWNLPRDGRHLT